MPHLTIKCKDEKDCTCSSKKKSHLKKVFSKKKSYSRPKKPYRFSKKKDPFSSKKVNFAKELPCPNKPAKSSRLLLHLQNSSVISAHDDIESLFSEQESTNEETIFALEERDTDSASNLEKI